jgi:Putative enzyme of poly-gamma-glutamate biosynthesis (capsule formation)
MTMKASAAFTKIFFRKDLGLMYFVSLDPSSGKLVHLQMTPTQVKRLKVNRASEADALWLRDTLNREGKRFGTVRNWTAITP